MQYAGTSFDLKTILKTSKISDHAQKHLSKVYSTLLMMVLSALVGAYVCMAMVGEIMPAVGLAAGLGGMVVMFALACTRKSNKNLRFALLMGFGVLEGFSLSPLLQIAVEVDERIIATAFLGTATIFLCFSLAALTSKRRSFLYLGGILGSTLSMLCLAGLVNLFFRSTFLFTIELYVGLAMFIGYVLFDTQMIIESAENGNDDFIWDAMKLFIDLVGIFVRILIILIKMNRKGGSKRGNPLDAVV